jgi:benzodiazapine receptor
MLKPWMVIGGVTLVVALFAALIKPRDIPWAVDLERPKWLFFEPFIPLIWTVVFACGAGSATLVWHHDPGSLKTWLLMGIYLLVEIVTVAYIPATLQFRSLSIGTILGGTGFILGSILALFVWSIAPNAALLLLPYVIWSPIGTYATRRMIDLNPDAA